MSSVNPKIIALLGPTNTGKTFSAMQRMLSFNSGIMGFPLRLLARENYDIATNIKGKNSVALITGEEKIIPENAKYFICTTESMPIDKNVEFIAVDEIQLAADRERGFIFTQRLLFSRGELETMFLGSESIKPLLQKIIKNIEFNQLERFSKLKYLGKKKLTSLPPKTAIVTFSTEEVYEIADFLRRSKGGAALVLGSLSPRTRNAQVDLYQSGEVDYIVATDAIGMGLNMDIDHVAFASLSKFDGKRRRRLSLLEIAQIAGRAGRHIKNGTFGTTASIRELSDEDIFALENHKYKAIERVYWRNNNLNFASIKTLLSTLKKPPPQIEFNKSPPADDQIIIEILDKNPEIKKRLNTEDNIRLLWDIAQVPDFRKLLPEIHSNFLSNVFIKLTEGRNQLSEDWINSHIMKLDCIEGDIHVLMDRIAAIRIWTYLTNRAGWVESENYWRKKTRQVEDNLSDALNEKLKQKFIDKKTIKLSKKLKRSEKIIGSVDHDNNVIVGGYSIGTINGLIFIPDKGDYSKSNKVIRNISNNVLASEFAKKINFIISDRKFLLEINNFGQILWNNEIVAKLSKGAKILEPKILIICDELCQVNDKQRLQQYIKEWFYKEIKKSLMSLYIVNELNCSGIMRGVIFQLVDNLGSFNNEDSLSQISILQSPEKKILSKSRVRMGVYFTYIPDMLRSYQIKIRGVLWKVFNSIPQSVRLPPEGRVSFDIEEGVSDEYYSACGFWVVNKTAYRVDMVERFSKELRNIIRLKNKNTISEKLSILGINSDQATGLLRQMGIKAYVKDDKLYIDFKYKKKNISAHSSKYEKSFNNKVKKDNKSLEGKVFYDLKALLD